MATLLLSPNPSRWARLHRRVALNRRCQQAGFATLYGAGQFLRWERLSPLHATPRVVQLSPTYFSEDSIIGGGERFPMSLAQAMARRTPTTFVTFGDRRRQFQLESLRVEVYPVHALQNGVPFDPVCFAFWRDLIRADVVHIHQYKSLVGNYALALGKALRKRVYLSDMGGWATDFTARLPIDNLVDGMLPITRFSAQLLPKHPNTAVLYGGVPDPFLAPVTKTDPGTEVLFVGRLLPHKGINYLVDAVDADTPLRIIGRVYHEPFHQLLRRQATGKQVRFDTSASDADLLAAYDRALVTVLCSVYDDVYGSHQDYPELLGLTLMESMARGTPVICTRVGGMTEVVDDGINGFIVPPNDAVALRDRIAYLQNHPDEARKMGAAAREKVERQFTWDAVAQRCLDAYRSDSNETTE